MIGRRAEDAVDLVDIGGEHHDAAGIAQHQRNAEGLEAQQQIERRREDQRGEHHGQGDVQRHAPDIRPRRPRGFFEVGGQAAHGGGDIKIDIGHMAEAPDEDHAAKAVDAPGLEAEGLLHPQGHEARGTYGDRVAEGQHDGGEEHGHKRHRLQPALALEIRARQQEGQHGAQRHSHRHQTEGEDGRGAQRDPEVGIGQHIVIGFQAQPRGLVEEGRVEEALVEDEPHGGHHHQHKGRDDRDPVALPFAALRKPPGGRHQPSPRMAFFQTWKNSARIFGTMLPTSFSSTGITFMLPPVSLPISSASSGPL